MSRDKIPGALRFSGSHFSGAGPFSDDGRPDRSPFALFHGYRHFGYSFAHLARQVRLSGAFLVGVSALFTAYADSALAVVAAIRKELGDRVRIVVGGHHATLFPAAVMAAAGVDFVIRGEGEEGLVALARLLRSGAVAPADWDRVAGLADGERLEAGRKLLSWFLHDGRIYGLTPEGEVYRHRVAAGLAEKTRRQLPRLFAAG